MGALLSCVLLGFCFLAEVTLLIVALGLNNKYRDNFENVLYEGHCTTAKRWTTLTALLLNFVATLTISSSNYVMQCLSSPSERELRHAHKNGRSLQIGVFSPSNISYLSPRKTAFWWLMGLSSIPVHLLLNSAIYSSLQAGNYGVAVVTSDFHTESPWAGCTSDNSNNETDNVIPATVLGCSIVKEADSYEKLDNNQCIELYSTQLLS